MGTKWPTTGRKTRLGFDEEKGRDDSLLCHN